VWWPISTEAELYSGLPLHPPWQGNIRLRRWPPSPNSLLKTEFFFWEFLDLLIFFLEFFWGDFPWGFFNFGLAEVGEVDEGAKQELFGKAEEVVEGMLTNEVAAAFGEAAEEAAGTFQKMPTAIPAL
jgi:hypothetical protein